MTTPAQRADEPKTESTHYILKGAVNFRDLGGYPVADGRRIIGGRLYRSDALSDLDAGDIARISALGVRIVIDLRAAEERNRRPNRLPTGCVTVPDGGFHLAGAEALLEDVRRGRMSADGVCSTLADIYRRAVTEDIRLLKHAVGTVIKKAVFPAVIHCTAGKDRTGLVIMSILLALGATREVIRHDYLLTDRRRRDIAFMFVQDEMTPVLAEAIEMMRAARSEFIDAAFAGIDSRWGGDEAFLTQGLGLSTDSRAALRRHLLERV